MAQTSDVSDENLSSNNEMQVDNQAEELEVIAAWESRNIGREDDTDSLSELMAIFNEDELMNVNSPGDVIIGSQESSNDALGNLEIGVNSSGLNSTGTNNVANDEEVVENDIANGDNATDDSEAATSDSEEATENSENATSDSEEYADDSEDGADNDANVPANDVAERDIIGQELPQNPQYYCLYYGYDCYYYHNGNYHYCCYLDFSGYILCPH